MENLSYEPNITAEDFFEKLKKLSGCSDCVVLDIRTADEFDTYHIRGAINLDFYHDDFGNMLDELERSKTYLLYCRTGRRTGTDENNALRRMLEMGFERVYNLTSGIHGFAKLPGADDWLD